MMKHSYAITTNGLYLVDRSRDDVPFLAWSRDAAKALRFNGPKAAQTFADEHVAGTIKIARLKQWEEA